MSKMQSTIANSTLIAEMIALFEGSTQRIWMRRLMHELKIKWKEKVTQSRCDNTGTIKTMNNIGFHEGCKHDEVKCGFIQKKILGKRIKASYVGTKDKVADFFASESAWCGFVIGSNQVNGYDYLGRGTVLNVGMKSLVYGCSAHNKHSIYI